MQWEQIGAWVAGALALAWANREKVIQAAALAIAYSEKAYREQYLADGELDEEERHAVLEATALKFLRRVAWLRWVPEGLLLWAVREACRRRKAVAQ